MTPDLQRLADDIQLAERLFASGRFEASLQSARTLLDAVAVLPARPGGQWRAELLGLVGRCALQLDHLDEALVATREALHALHALHDETLNPLLDGFRENLLTILAALEVEEAHADEAAAPTHRALRAQILRAQALTDRFRFARSTAMLEPLVARVQELGDLPAGPPQAEPADARLWYLPRMLGLLGFNGFHSGDLPRARAQTEAAIAACRALGDRTGERVYRANLGWIETQVASKK